jgi:hypothetical protein
MPKILINKTVGPKAILNPIIPKQILKAVLLEL